MEFSYGAFPIKRRGSIWQNRPRMARYKELQEHRKNIPCIVVANKIDCESSNGGAPVACRGGGKMMNQFRGQLSGRGGIVGSGNSRKVAAK